MNPVCLDVKLSLLPCAGVWRLGDERREVPQLPGSPAASVRALRGLLRLWISEEKRALLPERGHGLLSCPQRRQQLHPDSQETHKPFPWVRYSPSWAHKKWKHFSSRTICAENNVWCVMIKQACRVFQSLSALYLDQDLSNSNIGGQDIEL